MEVSQQALLKIAELASTLVERLDNCFVPDEAEDNNKLAMSRLKAWCQLVAQSNPEKLAKRLVWDELDCGTTGLGSIVYTFVTQVASYAFGRYAQRQASGLSLRPLKQ